jgi:hypothetical protein
VLRVHLEAEPPHLNPLLDGHQVIQRVVSGLVYETCSSAAATATGPAWPSAGRSRSDGLRLLLHLGRGCAGTTGTRWARVDVQASIEPLLRASSRQPALRALLGDIEAWT